jgi:beta-phosphoglucomutase
MNRSTLGVIWDVDGTLVDTAEQHFVAWQRFAVEVGHDYTRDDFARTFGWRNPEIFRTLFRADASDELCATWGDRKETLYRESVRTTGATLLPGVAQLLAAFANAGWPQALGSSAPRGNLDLLIAATNTAHYFTHVVSGDDVTKGKPNPEVFLKAAAGIGMDPRQCVVFEDAVAGVAAARAGGIKCIAVTFVGHHPAEKLLDAGADRVVASLEEVTLDDVRELFND